MSPWIPKLQRLPGSTFKFYPTEPCLIWKANSSTCNINQTLDIKWYKPSLFRGLYMSDRCQMLSACIVPNVKAKNLWTSQDHLPYWETTTRTRKSVLCRGIRNASSTPFAELGCGSTDRLELRMTRTSSQKVCWWVIGVNGCKPHPFIVEKGHYVLQ